MSKFQCLWAVKVCDSTNERNGWMLAKRTWQELCYSFALTPPKNEQYVYKYDYSSKSLRNRRMEKIVHHHVHSHTVKARNFGPHGNFGPIFQKGLLSLKCVLQKSENKSCRKTLHLQILFTNHKFCSFFVHDSSTEATELERKSPKFPSGQSFQVRGFYGSIRDVPAFTHSWKFGYICLDFHLRIRWKIIRWSIFSINVVTGICLCCVDLALTVQWTLSTAPGVACVGSKRVSTVSSGHPTKTLTRPYRRTTSLARSSTPCPRSRPAWLPTATLVPSWRSSCPSSSPPYRTRATLPSPTAPTSCESWTSLAWTRATWRSRRLLPTTNRVMRWSSVSLKLTTTTRSPFPSGVPFSPSSSVSWFRSSLPIKFEIRWGWRNGTRHGTSQPDKFDHFITNHSSSRIVGSLRSITNVHCFRTSDDPVTPRLF